MAALRKAGYFNLVILAVAVAAGPAHAFFQWPFGKQPQQKDSVVDPAPYEVRIDSADPSLARSIQATSILIERKAEPPSGIAGLIARVKTDRDRLMALMYENAFYGAQVIATVNDQPVDSLNAFSKLRLPAAVHVRVIPGPGFRFGRVQASSSPKTLDLDSLGLAPGQTASSKTVLAGEAALLEAWREAGYPLAKISERRVIADHKTKRLDVSLNVTPGPRAAIGTVSTAGEKDVRASLIIARSGLMPGMDYHPDVLKDAEVKLRALAIFAGVRVTIAENLDSQGRIPVLITVEERKPRVIGASASFSNVDGAALEAFWQHRNLFGGAESLKVTAGVSRLGVSGKEGPDFKVTGRFRKPAVLSANTDFTFGALAERETTEAYRKHAAGFDVGFEHTFNKSLSASLTYELERSQITPRKGQKDDYLLTGLNGLVTYDSRDNKLDATEGLRVMARIRPTYDLYHKSFFTTLRLDASTYYALDPQKRFVLAGRIGVGMVTARDVLLLPPDRRMYAGGAGSIRGFAYQGLGPRDAAGNLTGGRSLLELSGELRVKMTDTVGLALFTDAGNAYDSYIPRGSDLKMSVGAGLRYLTPIGPFRLDVAMPVKRDQYDPRFGIYVGLGQSF